MRLAGHVARMEERCAQDFGEESRGKDLEDQGIDGRIILRLIFTSGMWGLGLDRFDSG